MMSPALHPATVEALASFRERRTKLLLMRAGLAAAVVLLLLMLLVALLDRATFMPDGLRQGLGYLGYVGAGIAAWWLALRYVKETRHLHDAARLMEKADYGLHERLLAAVELSEGGRENDSAEFRGKLQDEVGAHLSSFKAESLLPSTLLKPWLTALGGIAGLILILAFVPGLHLPGFMARAALPFANLSRPSSVKIKIVTPVKADALVPMASSVPIGVEIEGPTPKRVMIETQSEDGKPLKMELSPANGNRYEGSIGIGQTNVRYRVLASDAITVWHTMEARPRPRIVEFTKTVTPPEYTGLPKTTVTEDNGDVSALEGSTVKLALKTNQEIGKSEATLSPNASILSVMQDKADMLAVTFALDGKADAWQLSLTSKDTEFTNDETTPWRIETRPDLPPTVTITSPEAQSEVRSDDLIQVSGNATDDVGLAKIELSYAINGADWKDTKLMDKAGVEAAIETPFKLAPLPIKSGDAVLLKLIATDLKGQRAESSPVRLFIVEDKLNLAKREWAAKQRQLAEQAKALMQESQEMRKNAEQARKFDKLAQKGKAEDEAEAANAKLKQNIASMEEKSQELWDQLKQSAKQAPDPLKSLETNMVGEQVAIMRDKHLKELHEQINAEQMDEKQLKEAASMTAHYADSVNETLRAFAAADTAQAVKETMEHLAPQQNRLADKAIDANRDPATRGKWQEQERAAIAAAENAHKDLEALKDVIQNERKRDVEQHLENFDKKLPGLKNALDNEQQHQAPEFVYGQAHEMRNAANQARDASRWFADETARKANEMRERLSQQQSPVLASLDQAKQQIEKAMYQKKDKPNEEPAQKQAADKLAATARQFKDLSELREQNPQTNSQAALDMNRLGRALENLADQAKRDATPEQIKATLEKAKQLSDSARALQADAQAQDAAQSLEAANQSAMSPSENSEQLASAQAAENQLKNLPNNLRNAQADNEAVNKAQEAAQNAQWNKNEVQAQAQQAAQQKQNGQPPQPIKPEQNNALKANGMAQQKLAESMEKFAPKVAEARNKLNELTPKLSELAKNTAEQLRESQQQTEKTADNAEKNQDAAKTTEEAAALMPKAKEDAQKLADLQSALRQEADKADLSNDAQRQMARTSDVGLAQLREQTPQIANQLAQAAKAQQAPQQQAEALKNAAKAQQQTAKGLDQLAQNLQKMEQGQALPQDALAAQQALEEAMGIKKPLDASYQEAKDLAQIMQEAQENPQAALNALEKELQKNPAMQRALGNVAEMAAQDTQKALTEAKTQPQAAPQADKTGAQELARVARHEQRLGQDKAAQTATKASQKLQELAKATKADAAQNTPQNAEQAAQTAQAAQQAASEAAQAQAEKTPEAQSFLETAKGAMLAQALDKLDQAVNQQAGDQPGDQGQQPTEQTPGGQQQAQQQGAQSVQQASAQKSAQQSLSQASQAQSKSMAESRAQGMVPGQQPAPQGQQPGQQPGQPGQPQQASDATGQLAQGEANLMVPVLVSSAPGDWGRLPSRMAKDLTEASRQEPSPEYRAAIESYYKAIAEKAKK